MSASVAHYYLQHNTEYSMPPDPKTKSKTLTIQQVEEALKSAKSKVGATEKVVDAANKILNHQGLTSNPSKLGKVVGRVHNIFETVNDILKPLEAAVQSLASVGVGLDIYNKSATTNPSEMFWIKGYKKTHDRIDAMRKRLTRYASNGLHLPAEINYSTYITTGLNPKSGNIKTLRAGLTIFEQLNDSIRTCDNRINLLKKYNQNLWNTYRIALKKERYATVLLSDHVDELRIIAIVMAAMERKIDTISMSGVKYLATFEEAKGDWGGLAQDCLKARERAAKDIKAFTSRKLRDKTLQKSMAETIRRRSSWISPFPSPRVSPNETRGPLGINK
jgi:hypothetical protein